MDVHLTGETLEVLHRGVRVASHVRSYEAARATTLIEHMPKSDQKYMGRTPSRLVQEAQQTGPYTGQRVEAILAAKRHPEMLPVVSGDSATGQNLPAERMEAAARRALRARAYNFQSLDSILKNQLDRLPLPDDPPIQHQHIFLVGPTGIGKTFLARAFGQKACRDGFTAYFAPAPQLFRELDLGRADGSYGKKLRALEEGGCAHRG